MKEYYYVEDLKEQYAESYKLIPEGFEDLRIRSYDIIDKVEIGGVLFVGINPSFDENNTGSCYGCVRPSEGWGYEHPYFVKPKLLNERIGDSGFSHVDLFSVRSRHQWRVRQLVDCSKSRAFFVEKQYELFRKIVDGTMPRCIVVINGMASGLIRDGKVLGKMQHDDELGVDMYEVNGKRIPVFYSGMLSGAHALDNGSFDRLLWHIKYVLRQT